MSLSPADMRRAAPAGLLSVTDVAKLRRCDHSTAWRLLTLLARDYDLRLVREGRTLRVSPAELTAALARFRGSNERRLLREIAGLRRRIAALEAREKRRVRIA